MPGPAEWWPEDYDYENNGWAPDKMDREPAEKTFDLITQVVELDESDMASVDALRYVLLRCHFDGALADLLDT